MTDKSCPLVGSCHKFSDGYGYGKRYLTSRNQITVPHSVPEFRYPAPTERYQRVTSSTKLVHNDNRAQLRNVHSIQLQTSGEVGRYLLDPRFEGEKLLKKMLQPHAKLGKKFVGTNSPVRDGSNGSVASQSNSSIRGEASRAEEAHALLQSKSPVPAQTLIKTATAPDWHSQLDSGRQESGRKSSNRSGNDQNPNISPYMSTLKQLDKSFTNSNRRDLVAASAPSRSREELVWCAANNNRGAMASHAWADRLRRESNHS
mmetsp:Transcript_3141/g.4906  ORF Transcript_3141/g.4906 Transcript_3141/m.4906 type:complete len:259 (+) Transcript_3141:53-829(+)